MSNGARSPGWRSTVTPDRRTRRHSTSSHLALSAPHARNADQDLRPQHARNADAAIDAGATHVGLVHFPPSPPRHSRAGRRAARARAARGQGRAAAGQRAAAGDRAGDPGGAPRRGPVPRQRDFPGMARADQAEHPARNLEGDRRRRDRQRRARAALQGWLRTGCSTMPRRRSCPAAPTCRSTGRC